MDAWRDFDIVREITAVCPYAITLCNDATAACAAEFFFGRGWRHRDFLYFFLGAFLGGGVVLDGALWQGRTGNAGALGSMPVMPENGGGAAPQLIARASIYQLERRLERAGVDASSMWATPDSWADFGPHLDAWIEDVASALAYASVAAISVIDFEAIVIDGAMPTAVRDRLTARTAQIFDGLDRRGLSDVEIVPGTDRGRRACDRRRRLAAHQEFRPRPGGSAKGRHEPGELRGEPARGPSSVRIAGRRNRVPQSSVLDELERGAMAPRIVKVDPFDLVVFGGTGDLAYRKLFPALFQRERERAVLRADPHHRRLAPASDRDAFRATREGRARQFVGVDADSAPGHERFLSRIDYVAVDITGD